MEKNAKNPKHTKQGTGAWTNQDKPRQNTNNDQTRSEGKHTDTDYQTRNR